MNFGLGLIAILVGATIIAAIVPLVLDVSFSNTSQFGSLAGVIDAVFPILISVSVLLLFLSALKVKGSKGSSMGL